MSVSQETRKKISKAMKKKWKDPSYRRKVTRALRAR
jgi:hypothetical protein